MRWLAAGIGAGLGVAAWTNVPENARPEPSAFVAVFALAWVLALLALTRRPGATGTAVAVAHGGDASSTAQVAVVFPGVTGSVSPSDGLRHLDSLPWIDPNRPVLDEAVVAELVAEVVEDEGDTASAGDGADGVSRPTGPGAAADTLDLLSTRPAVRAPVPRTVPEKERRHGPSGT